METRKPQDLIKKSDVQIVLTTDKGIEAVLKAYETINFTKRGDNYSCIVTSIAVQYEILGAAHHTSYIAKLNPLRSREYDSMTNALFAREIGFYSKILPLLNKELDEANESQLRLPRYFHSVSTRGNEVIYFEDMRESGFRMVHKHEAMDRAHTSLIVKELARYHAASHLMLSKEGIDATNIDQKFTFMKDLSEMFGASDKKSSVDKMLYFSMKNTAELVKDISGYEYVDKFVKSEKDNIFSTSMEFMEPKKSKTLFCLSHGDCWINNFLFRYDSVGKPVDCRLLDLQSYNVSTPGMDLNHMLFSSVDCGTRRNHLTCFLDSYYAEFSSILAGRPEPKTIPFTVSALRKEFHQKNMFGLMMFMVIVPILFLPSEDSPTFEDFFSEDVDASMAKTAEKIKERVKNSETLRRRLLETFDEFSELGIFQSNNDS